MVFSPTVPLSVLGWFLGWPNLVGVQNSLKYKGPLPLSCSCGREHIPFTGLTDDATFRTSSSVEFGADFWISCVYDDMLERSFVSLRDGDRPDLTPLGDSPLLSPSLASASTSLRSTYEAWKASWYAYEGIFGGRCSFRFYCSLFLCSAQFFFGLLFSVVSVLALEGVPALVFCSSSGRLFCLPTSSSPSVSSLRARSRSPCRTKRPLVLLRPRGDGGSTVVTGAPPGLLSARCVVFTVSPCLIIFPIFPVLL